MKVLSCCMVEIVTYY
uniref:Uncharacterized protein n=1 Tax=Rhizophora mucronata TaxID=61149 RepID=A0A2P2PUW7_RHIMU